MDALIVIFITGLISLFIAFLKKPIYVLMTSTLGLLIATFLLINQWNNPVHLFNYEGLYFTNQSIAFSAVAVVFTLLIIWMGYQSFKKELDHTGEYIALLLFSLTGAMCMVAFTDMFMFFIGLEIMSIPIYVLAGSNKKDIRSSEAALKYFLMGAFATGILLFGIAWIYGATGSFKIAEITAMVSSHEVEGPMLSVGLLLILASFLFKVGAAPFHFWSPDVYDGSPTPVTGFMATVVKLGAFGAFLKLFNVCFDGMHEFWMPALYVLAVVTMFVGNLSAIKQIRFKRLMAYSSITHVGYALLTIIVSNDASSFNLWFYMFGYGFSTIALMLVAGLINDSEDRLDAFKGLGKRSPWLATIAILGLLSLAGVPPLMGFFGKYMVFSNAMVSYPMLVIIAVVNSGIAIYYYLRLIITILSPSDNETETKIQVPTLSWLIILICAIVLLTGGFLPLCMANF
jgi:NADH-quinone oxidoreductase subunit N